ncbi:SMC-Scp complex subunit ScpB [Candidatus Sumerlaeota bacterium]|nr:SMC-Scp complex subunit ScpB [Candidatus Sumerlaeota bacterium]
MPTPDKETAEPSSQSENPADLREGSGPELEDASQPLETPTGSAAPEPVQTDFVAEDPLTESVAAVVSADPASKISSPKELRAAIEALLFASPEPVSIRAICRALTLDEDKVVRQTLRQLMESYDTERRGFQIIESAGGYQMATREEFEEFIIRLGQKKKRQALSPAALETLAIIAYRQPIIRAEVESIRGVESSGVMRNLADLELIEITGRKEVIGRPSTYGTTEKFLRTFALRNLRELPSIRELRKKEEEQPEEKKPEKEKEEPQS